MPFARALVAGLLVCASTGPAAAAPGTLAGFGNVPFGTSLELARVARGVEVRETTWTFADGARIRQKRDATPDGTCAVRVFYRPGSSRPGEARF